MLLNLWEQLWEEIEFIEPLVKKKKLIFNFKNIDKPIYSFGLIKPLNIKKKKKQKISIYNSFAYMYKYIKLKIIKLKIF